MSSFLKWWKCAQNISVISNEKCAQNISVISNEKCTQNISVFNEKWWKLYCNCNYFASPKLMK